MLDGHAGLSAARHVLTGAATGVTTPRLRAGLCARAPARRTALASCQANAFFASRGHALKGNLDQDFEIFAARRTGASSTKNSIEQSPAAEAEVETQAAEDFIEIDPAIEVFWCEAGDAGKARSIVLAALFRI